MDRFRQLWAQYWDEDGAAQAQQPAPAFPLDHLAPLSDGWRPFLYRNHEGAHVADPPVSPTDPAARPSAASSGILAAGPPNSPGDSNAAPMCRICYDEEVKEFDEMISPCLCRGSSK